jgi:hypothetical protein
MIGTLAFTSKISEGIHSCSRCTRVENLLCAFGSIAISDYGMSSGGHFLVCRECRLPAVLSDPGLALLIQLS